MLASCSTKEEYNIDKDKSFLVTSFYRDIDNGQECIWFGSDGYFSYSEITSKNHVEDYDLCSTFNYDKEKEIITIDCEYGKQDETIQVLSFD